MADLQLDEAAITEMLTSEHDIVGLFLADLVEQAATVARARVPVRRTPSWSPRSDASPPGFTLARIHTEMGHHSGGLNPGGLWASANAPLDPTVFLEDPRRDRRKEPFLTTGLDSLEGLLLCLVFSETPGLLLALIRMVS